jgi:cytoskeletal protein CcmA (bactofilin family)
MWNRETTPRADGTRPAAAPGAPERPPEERRVVAWVGKSVVFKGDLSSSEDMTIDGRVEGRIDVPGHRLTLGPDADIRATVTAKTVTVFGTVRGAITAEYIDLRETSHVEGDIISPRVMMVEGAMFRGRIEPTKERAAQAARTSQPAAPPPA